MNKFIHRAALVLMLMPSAGSAQDFNKGKEAYVANDFGTAFNEWMPLAKQGNARAQFNLAWLYGSGKGVPQDYTEAAKWYRLSAEQGEVNAQFNLAVMYANGEGVPQNYISAHMWFNIASANGDNGAEKNRDEVATVMNQEDISKAQHNAKICMASAYNDCD